jgi:hypothetical protein
MDSAKINDWVQVGGIFALVASLIFVGLQLQQSQDIALSQASQSRTSATVEILVNSAENSHYVSSIAKRQRGDSDALTIEERVVIRNYALVILYLYEDQHYQYINGFLPEERWQAAKATLANFLSGEGAVPIRSTYEEFPARFPTTFQTIVNGLIVGIKNEAEPE